LFIYGIVIIIAGGLFSAFAAENRRVYAALAAVLAGGVMCLIPAVNVLFFHGTAVYDLFGIIFSLDPLSAFFSAIIVVLSFFSVLYSVPYMKGYYSKEHAVTSHYIFLTILIASMLMVTAARDAVAFMISWEIMALSSFFLVIFENGKKEVVDAGIYYLIMSHISAVLLICGFAFASGGGAGLSFEAIGSVMANNRGQVFLPFILFFSGFAIKAGLVPGHTWLPKAHPAAPAHISALMSAIMIEMGIYGTARIIMIFPPMGVPAGYVVLFFGILTALTGILYSISQRDIKKALAYSSIENAGIMAAGLGLGMLGISYNRPYMALLGFIGAFLQVLNHSIFKSLLFFGSGTIYRRTHTLDVEKLGGLSKKMPVLSLCFLLGCAAISGLPPFNGFISEFIIFLSMIQAAQTRVIALAAAGIIGLAGLAFTGSMAVISFTRLYSGIFSGTARLDNAKIEKGEGVIETLIFMILAAASLFIGLFPQAVYNIVYAPAAAMLASAGMSPLNNTALAGQLSGLSGLFLILCGVVLAIMAFRSVLLKNRVKSGNTWGCAYKAPTSRMQYTTNSYAAPFTAIMEPFAGKKEVENPPVGIFPSAAEYKTGFTDFFEKYLINAAGKAGRGLLKLFTWIQNGSLQRYIIYTIIFLALSIVWAVR
jgi:formate hydrogenlyase subunit 3/multisubunit Na+/H+ antiporter MnhD subunit